MSSTSQNETPLRQGDHIVRAMTNDGSFRLVTVRSSETVSDVLTKQAVGGSTARHLADLTTGALLIRETMSPAQRVQGILKRVDRPGYLLADSHPSGRNRGLVSLQDERDGFRLENAALQLMRTLQNGQIQQGVVAVPSDGDVSQALMAYMQESEQITTMIAVSTLFDAEPDSESGVVRAAGGYLLQLLPGAHHEMLAIMTERLEDFRNIERWLARDDFGPQLLVDEILYGMEHTMLEDSEIEAGCWCSHASMMAALSSLNRGEIQSMVDDGEVLEIQCDYCRKQYHVSPSQLRGLLDQN